MARNPTDKILYDGSADRATLLMSPLGTKRTRPAGLVMSVVRGDRKWPPGSFVKPQIAMRKASPETFSLQPSDRLDLLRQTPKTSLSGGPLCRWSV